MRVARPLAVLLFFGTCTLPDSRPLGQEREPLVSNELAPLGGGLGPPRVEEALPVVAHARGLSLVAFYEGGLKPFARILAQRIADDGTNLDPTPLEIASVPNGPILGDPHVSTNGTDFLVTFFLGTPGVSQIATVARRVLADGGLPDTAPLVLDPNSQSYGGSCSVFDGQNYFVAWETGDTVVDLLGTWVTPGGQVGAPFTLVSTPDNDIHSAAASGAGTTLLVWVRSPINTFNPGNLYATRVGDAGAIDTNGILIFDGGAYGASAVFDGTDFLVAWTDGAAIYARRVGVDGSLREAAPLKAGSTPGIQAPAMANAGSFTYLQWGGPSGGLEAARIAGGALIDPTPLTVLPKVQGFGDVAWIGTSFLSTVEVGSGLGLWQPEIVATLHVGPDGGALDSPSMLSLGAPEQSNPDIAFGDGGYLVVWSELRGYLDDVYAARLSREGYLLDPAPITVAASPLYEGWPAVRWGGDVFLVSWVHSASFEGEYAAGRIDAEGDTLDDGGFELSTGAFVADDGTQGPPPGLTWNGTDFVLAWSEWDGVKTRRVSPGGSMRDPLSVTDAGGVLNPVISCGDATCLMVHNVGSAPGTMMSVAIARDGSPLDAGENQLDTQGTFANLGRDDAGYVLLWASGNIGRTLYVARLDDSGATQGMPVTLDVQPNAYYSGVALAFDGACWHAAWGTGGPMTVATLDTQLNVLALEDAGIGSRPRMAFAGPGDGMLVFTRFDTPTDPERVHVVRLCSAGPCVLPDSGFPVVDAGSNPDSGVGVDAGLPDGGETRSDGGGTDAGVRRFDVGLGCNCQSAGGALVCPLVILRRRKRPVRNA